MLIDTNYLAVMFGDVEYKFPKIIDSRFKLIRQFDKGSFGSIFRATDLQNREKKVVVKIVVVSLFS